MRFSKMHGLGNDFVIVDGVTQNVHLSREKIKILSNRCTGIGFDQLLIVEPPYNPELDFHCSIFNADGSQAVQCLNGARCVGLYVFVKGLTKKKCIKISTTKNLWHLEIIDSNKVIVKAICPSRITTDLSNYDANKKLHSLPYDKGNISFDLIDVGNLHCIIDVKDFETIDINNIGKRLSNHDYFHKSTGANISFVKFLNKDEIYLRIYERGVGETLSCGSAAAAAVCSGVLREFLNNSCLVHMQGGSLTVNWPCKKSPIQVIGNAHTVFDGNIDI